MRVFVSYATKDGLSFGREARKCFKAAGHEVWFYSHDRTPGASTWREIGTQVLSSDLLFYICTSSSVSSKGQVREAGIALNNQIRVFVVKIDDATAPPELTAENYLTWDSKCFTRECNKLAKELPDFLALYPSLERVNVTALAGSDAIEERYRNLRELNVHLDRLDQVRAHQCKTAVLKSYLEATRPRRIAAISTVFDPRAKGFRVIGIASTIKLERFNGPNVLWDSYFSQVGRAVATGETKYLHEVINRVKPGKLAISRSKPEFDRLTECVQALLGTENEPDRLLVPIEMFVPFYMHYGSNIQSSSDGEVLTIEQHRLSLFWSYAAAPLSRFVLLNSNALIWRIKPDPETKGAITIALGCLLYPDQVEYVVETRVKCELGRPQAVHVIPLRT